MKYKRTIYLVSGAACLFLAAGLILYPILGNALAEKNKSLVMTEYSWMYGVAGTVLMVAAAIILVSARRKKKLEK